MLSFLLEGADLITLVESKEGGDLITLVMVESRGEDEPSLLFSICSQYFGEIASVKRSRSYV